jgi:hypothetical protein
MMRRRLLRYKLDLEKMLGIELDNLAHYSISFSVEDLLLFDSSSLLWDVK